MTSPGPSVFSRVASSVGRWKNSSIGSERRPFGETTSSVAPYATSAVPVAEGWTQQQSRSVSKIAWKRFSPSRAKQSPPPFLRQSNSSSR